MWLNRGEEEERGENQKRKKEIEREGKPLCRAIVSTSELEGEQGKTIERMVMRFTEIGAEKEDGF